MHGARSYGKGFSGYMLVENASAIAARSSGRFWPGDDVSSVEEFGSYSSSDFLLSTGSRHGSSQRYDSPRKENCGVFIPSKEDRNRAVRKKLLERQMLINRRIMMQQRREDERKALVEEQRQKMKQQWQTKNQMNAAVNHARRRTVDQIRENKKHAIMVKLMREDEARIRQLGESRDIERREKEDVYYKKVVKSLREMEERSVRSRSGPSEGPDSVYTELWFRQERLMQAISDKSLSDIQALLAFSPTVLHVRTKKIFEDYAPHKQMQLLVNEFVANKISEEFFFQEAAELAKKLTPAHVIEHYRRVEANKNNRRKLMRVSSQTMVDRYTVAWASGRLGDDRAKPVAQRVVDDTVELARGVYSRMMRGSSCNLALIGIGEMDLTEQAEREHVQFDDDQTEIPRPLEPHQDLDDLKPTADRPPTPVPSEEQLRHVLEMMPDVQGSKLELVEQIVVAAERQLRENIDSGSVDRKMAAKMGVMDSLTSMREHLRENVAEKVETIQGPEGASESERQEFVKDISTLVSNVVGSTLADAKSVLKDALGVTQGKIHDLLASQNRKSKATEQAGTSLEAHFKKNGMESSATDLDQREGGADRKMEYKPKFGGKPLQLKKQVLESSLAAISVAHSTDVPGHEGHSHMPPVSHLKMFMKSRGSVPIVPTSPMIMKTLPKRLSLPTTLPVCMDSNKMQMRHSFMDVFEPDLHDLPEYQDKNRNQVEQVLVDHSAFGRLHELLPDTISEEDTVVQVENLDQERDEEDEMQKSPSAGGSSQESVVETPPIANNSSEGVEPAGTPPIADKFSEMMAARGVTRHHSIPTQTVSLVLPKKTTSSFTQMKLQLHSKRISVSDMLLRCDSNPKLTLRPSRAEFGICLHEHDTGSCMDHVSEPEPEEELQAVESAAFGIGVKDTISDAEINHGETKDILRGKQSIVESDELMIAEADEIGTDKAHGIQEAAGPKEKDSATSGKVKRPSVQFKTSDPIKSRSATNSTENVSQPAADRLKPEGDSHPNLKLHSSRAEFGVSVHDHMPAEHESDGEAHGQSADPPLDIPETTDSDLQGGNLKLHASRAEFGVSLHDHMPAEQHTGEEAHEQLQAMESADPGLDIPETTSDSDLQDTNLKLHASRAEFGVSLHDHECTEHQSHDEAHEQLEAMESVALGLGVKATTSDTDAQGTGSRTARPRRPGSGGVKSAATSQLSPADSDESLLEKELTAETLHEQAPGTRPKS